MTATVAIVGYRAYAELRRCLESLAQFEPETDVIVVDHASDANVCGALAAMFPRVRFRPTAGNPGFGAGINAAAREVAGPLLILNPDCELTRPVLQPLLAVLAGQPRAGIVGGLVRNPNGDVQPSARRFPDVTSGVAGRTAWLSRVAPGNPLTRRNLTTDPREGTVQVDWVTGAFMLVRRETFDALGGFDEQFFLYWEDADFCKRAAAAGWGTWYAPVAEVIHWTGSASRYAPTRSLAAFHASAFRYYWKHGGAVAKLLSPVAAVALAGRFILRAVTRG